MPIEAISGEGLIFYHMPSANRPVFSPCAGGKTARSNYNAKSNSTGKKAKFPLLPRCYSPRSSEHRAPALKFHLTLES